jgi:hypothetical protein
MIAGGERYRILFPSAYMRRYHGEVTDRLLVTERCSGAYETSFWMQVQGMSR